MQESPGIVHSGAEGQRRDRADPWHRHQEPTSRVTAHGLQNQTMQSGVLPHQRFASGKQWIHDRLQQGVIADRLTNSRREQSPRDDSDFETERTQKSADDLLCGSDGADDMLASRGQRPRPLAADALDVNGLEPSRSHHLRDPTGVIPIGLHRHGRKRRLNLSGFQTDGRQPQFD
ncbi:hypothetical protein XI01_03265 [Bradyrhizobium sp. CCBAU 21360]|nr:hypothetical protein [Bradyrhizobium sp. CCBAU 21360]